MIHVLFDYKDTQHSPKFGNKIPVSYKYPVMPVVQSIIKEKNKVKHIFTLHFFLAIDAIPCIVGLRVCGVKVEIHFVNLFVHHEV